MSKDPAFLFYPGDWLGGTMTMTRHHKGAYMDILMAQFNEGHMSLQQIKTVLGEKDEHLWEEVLKKKFKEDESGLFYNEKLENEIVKRRVFTESRRRNLSHTGKHMEDHKGSDMGLRMENENENENKNNKSKCKPKTPLPDNFEISDRVRKWASEKGHVNLEQHLESFKLKCRAKDYRYVNWDDAFMNAIRDNWANISNASGNQPPRASPTHVSSCPTCGSRVQKSDLTETGCVKCRK
jgi:uncharacterized protein YdaU (DUF1376 family)